MKRYFKLSFIGIVVIGLVNSAEGYSVKDSLSNGACSEPYWFGARVVRKGRFDFVATEIEKFITESKDRINETIEQIRRDLEVYAEILKGDWSPIWVGKFRDEIDSILQGIESKLAKYKEKLNKFNQEVKAVVAKLDIADSGNKYITVLREKSERLVGQFEATMEKIWKILDKKIKVKNPVISAEIKHFKEEKIEKRLEELEMFTYQQLFSIDSLLSGPSN